MSAGPPGDSLCLPGLRASQGTLTHILPESSTVQGKKEASGSQGLDRCGLRSTGGCGGLTLTRCRTYRWLSFSVEKQVYVSESFSSIVMEEMMTGARRVLSWSSSTGSYRQGEQSIA